MNINAIVKAHFLEMDDDDESEIDWFMNKIDQTSEYRQEVLNEIDFDFDDLLHAIASDGDVDAEIEEIKNQIRSNAKDLYQNTMIDLVQEAQDEKDAHGDHLYEVEKQRRVDAGTWR